MKRSDMLVEMLEEYMQHKHSGIVSITTVLNKILKRQEKLGMIPPYIAVEDNDVYLQKCYEENRWDIVGYSTDSGNYVHDWEPENEKK